MDHFAGLDVSVKETSVCIVDDTGKIVREVKVASEPEALLAVLKNPAYHFKRIGLEAGPLSQWLFSALAEAELPVVCVETRHMQAVLKAQINKTDRNDARGIAQMIRVVAIDPPASGRSSFLNRCGSLCPVSCSSVSSGISGVFDQPLSVQSRCFPPCSEEFGGKSGGNPFCRRKAISPPRMVR